MKIKQHQYINQVWTDSSTELDSSLCQLVLVFGTPKLIREPDLFDRIRAMYPNACLALSSTAGEIMGAKVYDETIVCSAIQFEHTKVKCVSTNIDRHTDSCDAGDFCMSQLIDDDLKGVFILADGTSVNGGDLVDGLNINNKSGIVITGGLAGDGDRFERTFTGLNSIPESGNIIAIGFYGSQVDISHGCFGGWKEFGEVRTITKSDKNILYEIDNQNALDLYEQYLGDFKDELPGSALLFPLSLRIGGSEKSIVRTILSVNEQDKSMTFAGNIPEGSKVRMMEANFFRIIDGAAIAAKNTYGYELKSSNELAILVSCVGRKLILQERTEEELISAKDELGNATITGFYSYGEISPFNGERNSQLHNQTMTITTIREY